MSRVEIYRERLSRWVTDFEDGPTRLGRWRWRFVASNGRIMADGSQGYARRIDALNGCATVLGGRIVVGDSEHLWVYRLTEGPGRDDPVPVVDLTREAKP